MIEIILFLSFSCSAKIVRSSSSKFWFQTHLLPVEGSDGADVLGVGLHFDINTKLDFRYSVLVSEDTNRFLG